MRCVLALFLPVCAGLGQQPTDFSGTWQVQESHSDSPTASRQSSQQHRGFTIRIRQTAAEVSLALPRLPVIIFKLDGSEYSYVHDNGASWTRFITTAKWNGSHLTLHSTTLNGWWKDSDPARITSQATQLEDTRTLDLEANGASLRIETLSRDEKPFAVHSVELLAKQL